VDLLGNNTSYKKLPRANALAYFVAASAKKDVIKIPQ
jgi:hypothetical protein